MQFCKKNFFIPILTGSAALLFACLVGLFHIHNADIWWHIAWGEKMLQLQTIFPAASNFYFTPIDPAYLKQLSNTFLGDIGLALLYHVTGVIGLQLLVLLCIAIAGAAIIFFPLRDLLHQKNKWHSVALLLFFGLCLGTCQLQMVRNALFSLAFFPMTLALFDWHSHRQEGWKVLFIYPLLFLIWSGIHSSYALGMMALVFLYAGLLADRCLKRPCFLLTSQISFMLLAPVFLLFFSFIYSHQIRALIEGAFFHGVTLFFKLLHLEASPNSSFLVENSLRPSWNSHAVPASGDFITTWYILRHPAAWSSMLLSLIAFVLLVFSRPRNQFGLLALLSFTTYFGAYYLRGTGYAAITALFVITSVLANVDKKRLSERLHRFLFPLFTFACVLLLGGMTWIVLSKQSEVFFKEKDRIFGFGKAAVFDDAPYLFVKRHFLNTPCFTTIVTGSYASFFWKDEKQVFIDGFFAPHPPSLWSDYRRARSTQDLSMLAAYGAQVAIVENNRPDWQVTFLHSPAWRPLAIGLGATVYAQNTLLSDPETPVALLFTQAEVSHLAAPTAQRALAAAYYNCILSLGLRGEKGVANNLIHQEDFFATLASYLDPSQRENIRLQPMGIKPELLRP